MIEYLISILRQRDVVLRLENGRLVCDAPQGAMTPDLIEQVEYNKAEIVRFLQRTGERDPSKSIRRPRKRRPTAPKSHFRSLKKACGFWNSSTREMPLTISR